MTKKEAVKFGSALCSFFLLCSFTNQANLSDFNRSVGEYRTYVRKSDGKYLKIGDVVKADLGRRNGGIIGQYRKFSVNSYSCFDAADNGYILSYEQTMMNPKAVTSLQFSYRASLSQSVSYSYSKSIGYELSNAFSGSLSLDGFGKIGSEIGSKITHVDTRTYSYTYGEEKSVSYTGTFDLGRVPSGYLFSPCLVCSAQILNLNYTIYDQYWWGDYPSKSDEEVNQDVSVLIIDKSTLEFTICIKREGASGKPAYYLHA